MNIRILIFTTLMLFVHNLFAQVKESDLAAYLMVYFKDESHGLYVAVSQDGYSFTDINKGKPIIAGDSIAQQKGIRDPYIMRGKDGYFYMVMTDLHIYAKKQGYRNTEWERDGVAFGWGNNRGIVLMKSPDLIHWKHTELYLEKAFKAGKMLAPFGLPNLSLIHI